MIAALALAGLLASPNPTLLRELERDGTRMLAVVFTASWCPPCKRAYPVWKDLHRRFAGQGLRFVFVRTRDAKRYGKKLAGWEEAVVIDDIDAAETAKLGVQVSPDALPQVILYDGGGRAVLDTTGWDGKGDPIAAARRIIEGWFTGASVVRIQAEGETLAFFLSAAMLAHGRFRVTLTGEQERRAAAVRRALRRNPEVPADAYCKPSGVIPDAVLEAKVVETVRPPRLTLELYPINGGCQYGAVHVPWTPKDPSAAAFAAVKKLHEERLIKALRRAKSRAEALGIAFRKLDGGSFLMGSATGDIDERPPRPVRVKAFELMESEVTNRQYWACVHDGGCTAPHWDDGTCWTWSDENTVAQARLPDRFRGDDQPVVCVEHGQAEAFARWLDPNRARLASEAEWEYAARGGGKDQAWPWGPQKADCTRAAMARDDNWGSAAHRGCGRDATWPVCDEAFRAGRSPQGICDLAGNAWEWVADCYHATYDGAPDDARAWTTGCGESPRRVIRGGSWSDPAGDLRAADRDQFSPSNRGDDVGFRLARSAIP